VPSGGKGVYGQGMMPPGGPGMAPPPGSMVKVGERGPQGFMHPPGPGSSSSMKKELAFPSESVEAVTPVLCKRKKLHKVRMGFSLCRVFIIVLCE